MVTKGEWEELNVFIKLANFIEIPLSTVLSLLVPGKIILRGYGR